MLAVCWIAVVAGVAWLADLLRQTQDHLTNGALRPFGDDFHQLLVGAWLAWHGRASTVYDFNAFHASETSGAGAAIYFCHYSYPPVLLVFSTPLAFIPNVLALFACAPRSRPRRRLIARCREKIATPSPRRSSPWRSSGRACR